MDVLIVTPGTNIERTGNRCTAAQWGRMLESCDFSVAVRDRYEGEVAPVLLALHGRKSHYAVRSYLEKNPGGKVIVALTGTDIYPEPDLETLNSMRLADRLITLQQKAVEKIPTEQRFKARVIVQSAVIRGSTTKHTPDSFQVCVVGHFRDVKDPLLTSRASRLLPSESTILIRHAGGILDPKYRGLVEIERKENPRYRWLGELSGNGTANLISESSLLVLTSHSEGGARVIGEAIVEGTPVLSTRIEGVIGLLGENYPGFFPVGSEKELADLLWRAESDNRFYQGLIEETEKLAPRFSPEREKKLLCQLVKDLEAFAPIEATS